MPQENKRLPSKDDRLQRWLNREKRPKKTAPDIISKPDDMLAPLSFGQQRLYFLQQLYPDNPFYHYSEAYKFIGILRKDHLINSFKKVGTRHDILRTVFTLKNSEPIQEINQELHIDMATFDLKLLPDIEKAKELKTIATAEASRPFDLEKGPLVRISLLHLDEHEYFMVLTMHHIITDKWSMGLLRKEWSLAYQDLPLPSQPKFRYADYTWSQRQQSLDQQHLAYWQKKLAGDLPQLTLPIDKPRHSIPTFEGAFCEKTFSSKASRKLQALCEELQTTMFVLFLSIYKVLLYRYSGQTDLLVGTPVTNRDHTSLEKLVGFFNETVVLRTELSSDMKFIDLVHHVRSVVLEAFSHKKVPFESIVQDLKPERLLNANPIFQVMFLYHKVPPSPDFGPDLQVEYKPIDFGVSKFDLTLYISEDKDGLSATFEYATDLFEHSTIDRMQGHLSTLIEEITVNPHQRIGDLPMLTHVERKHILEWNKTKAPVPEVVCIHQLIEAQAMANPDKPAVIFQKQSLTYADLNERSNDVSGYLQHIVTNPGGRIGLYMDRSLDFIIGMLGILKAGHAYVPLDPEYPSERIQFMVQDSEMSLVLTQPHLMTLVEGFEIPVQILETKYEMSPTQNTLVSTCEDDTAYIMYTSGSTGQPKGVPVSHKNLLYSTTARFAYYRFQPEVFMVLSSFSFDSSVAGIFWTLCSGGTLILSESRLEQDLDLLAAVISKHQVTHTLLLPSLYTLLVKHASTQHLASLKTVIVAGETCTPEVSRRHFEKLPNTELYNEYGPTEATVWSTVQRIELKDTTGMVPIGRPTPNSRVYILDTKLQPVPIGVVGELYIGGPGVVKGYLKKPELTKKSFVPDPFSDNASARLYKTGDLCKYRECGTIDYLGRIDQQVKIRGHRIEPDEIQEVLCQYPGVEEAIVIGIDPQEFQKNNRFNDLDSLTEDLESVDPETAEHLLKSVELSRLSDDN